MKRLAVLLTVLAFTSALSGCGQQQPERTQAVPAVARPTSHTRTDELRPIRLTIPGIDVRTSVVSLGLNPDQTVEVPSDPTQAGWYRFGSVPGRPGSTVILGHVDSDNGPAVFYRLRQLALGDHIEVRLADGSRAQFEVDNIATYANARFPATQVYRADGPSHVILVTCGGRYDAARGGYQANLVVSALLIGSAALGGSDG